jgi:DNA-binding CsgD family transcriptional regulator
MLGMRVDAANAAECDGGGQAGGSAAGAVQPERLAGATSSGADLLRIGVLAILPSRRLASANRAAMAVARRADSFAVVCDTITFRPRRRVGCRRRSDRRGVSARARRAESRVAVRLAAGASLAAIASELRVGAGTVRRHLEHLFLKTGTRGQVELAALVHRYRLPLDLAAEADG